MGAGTAILLGTFAGLCSTAHTHPEADLFMERLLVSAGVQPDRCGGLLRRRRTLDDQEAWFMINPTAAPVTERLSFDGWATARDLLGDALDTAEPGALTLTVPPMALRCLTLTRDAG